MMQKKSMEQGAEESNLGSMEQKIRHKIIVFCMFKIFASLRSAV